MEEQVTEVEQEVIMTINNPRSTSVATIMACWFGLLKNNREIFPNGKREFAQRDQVFPLVFVNCLLLVHENK